jgi:phosphoribosyl-ATP pyrophosphohydrolase/phosphoribosyl-AMP cyclohydrolase
MIEKVDIRELKFDTRGIIPAVVQDVQTGSVLTVAYMNRESLEKTLLSGETYFWSRSREAIWHKGSTSGNTQTVKSITADCDRDALLVRVEQKGVACHTGEYSCFHNLLTGSEESEGFVEVLGILARRIAERKREMPEGSYTTKLFREGGDRILKKIGEEAGEIIIAAKNHSRSEIAWEVADLLYHLLVLLEHEQVPVGDIGAELGRRARKKK